VLPLGSLISRRFDPGPDSYWTLAVDDSPTKRYGRHVEAATFITTRRLGRVTVIGSMVIAGFA
jgi:hypothetical protein